MMNKDKSYKVKHKLYVGKFKGSSNGGPTKIFIGISEYEHEPSMSELDWLTIPEARRLRDGLTKLIGD